MADFNPKDEEIIRINETPGQRKAALSTNATEPSLVNRVIRFVTSPKFKRALIILLSDDDPRSSGPRMQA